MADSVEKIMYLDESGDHSLDIIDPQYPVFVLGGVIMDAEYANRHLEAEVNDFKMGMFGRTDIILHTSDLARNRNGFERMKEEAFRNRFYEQLNLLMAKLEYKVVACVVRKDEHAIRYGIGAIDPYMLALNVLVERFCFEVGNIEEGGMIVAEKRNPTLDHELELAWLGLKIRGTHYLPAKDVEKRIRDLRVQDKKKNMAGLQLADLVVSPIGRHVLGKVEKEDFRIIKEKFRRDHKGNHHGYGLVVLPGKRKDQDPLRSSQSAV